MTSDLPSPRTEPGFPTPTGGPYGRRGGVKKAVPLADGHVDEAWPAANLRMSGVFDTGIGLAPGVLPAGKTLVAEHDLDLLFEIESILREDGHDVVRAREGQEALRLARRHSPELVILDVSLPGISGYEVCRRLRSDWRFVDRGIIMLSWAAYSMQRSKGLAAGADDFVLKPLNPLELAARVRVTLWRLKETHSRSSLTGLPGNESVQRELHRRAALGHEVALLYLDLDHFKAYNDAYGFPQGDEAIRTLAEVLRNAVAERPDAFLGHVGGDDFVLLARPEDAECIARAIISSFEARVHTLHQPGEAALGWMEVGDRQRRKQRHDQLTLSIGVANSAGRRIQDHRRLVEVATEMKQYAKSRPGNVVAVDRRRPKSREIARGRSGMRSGLVVAGSHRDPHFTWTRSSDPRGAGLIGFSPGHARRHRVRGVNRGPLRRFVVRSAVALLTVMMVVGPSTMVLAEHARPGQLLWEVRLRIEGARLRLERRPANDVLLHLEFASGRIEDLRYVLALEKDPSLMTLVTENLGEHEHAVVVILSRIVDDGGITDALRTQSGAALGQNVEVLEGLVATACEGVAQPGAPPDAACSGLQTALAASSGRVNAIHALGAPATGVPGSGREEAPDRNAATVGPTKGAGERPGRRPPGRESSRNDRGDHAGTHGKVTDREMGQGKASGKGDGKGQEVPPSPPKSKDEDGPNHGGGAKDGGDGKQKPPDEPPEPEDGTGQGPPETPPRKTR